MKFFNKQRPPRFDAVITPTDLSELVASIEENREILRKIFKQTNRTEQQEALQVIDGLLNSINKTINAEETTELSMKTNG